jgi:hypothetical protein
MRRAFEFVRMFIKDTGIYAKDFVARYRLTFPTGLVGRQSLRQNLKVGPSVKFFISGEGHIIERVSGPMTENDLVRSIECLTK